MNELAPISRSELPRSGPAIAERVAGVLAKVESGPLNPDEAAANENMLAALAEMARRSGVVSEPVQIDIWIARFLNRWRLGEALANIERNQEGPTGPPIKKVVAEIGVAWARAHEAQRLAAMPWREALAFRDRARENENFRTFAAGLSYARRWWQKARRRERLEEIGEAATLGELGQRYPIILADPPWRYENPPIGAGNRSIENHYPTMALEEICALPIADDVAADDCTLYLWATAPKLAECFQVLEAWRFLYRTNFVWIKDKIGMGYHARSQHELLLVAKRGEVPPPEAEDRVSSVIEAPRGAHSEKPDRVYELLERFYPTLPKVELFQRGPHKRLGWDVWGNEAAA